MTNLAKIDNILDRGFSGQARIFGSTVKGQKGSDVIWKKGRLTSEKGLLFRWKKENFKKIPVTKGIFDPKQGSKGLSVPTLDFYKDW